MKPLRRHQFFWRFTAFEVRKNIKGAERKVITGKVARHIKNHKA